MHAKHADGPVRLMDGGPQVCFWTAANKSLRNLGQVKIWPQSRDTYQDQVNGHDKIQQARDYQDQDSSDQRHERLERNDVDGHDDRSDIVRSSR
jgi:hypothetical protein